VFEAVLAEGVGVGEGADGLEGVAVEVPRGAAHARRERLGHLEAFDEVGRDAAVAAATAAEAEAIAANRRFSGQLDGSEAVPYTESKSRTHGTPRLSA